MNLREKIVKLAKEHPELRSHLIPVLQKTAGGHDAAATYEYLERAATDLFMGKATSSLEQVSRFSAIPEAQGFAEILVEKLDEVRKDLRDYLYNNRDLTREPPRVR
jgi:hypothetical protein